MIDLTYIRGFYPPFIANNAICQKHILKEYIELLSLEWLSRSEYAKYLCFIGGTNLRLIQGIDRFSEDLYFDCKHLDESGFVKMTNELIRYLRMQGLQVEARDKVSSQLMAYRRNVYFPELLFSLQLTGHREERFLMKIEAQDQGVDYPVELATVQRLGFYFPVAVPPLSVMLSMKLSALLSRGKGRDFYDTLFLWQRTQPDYAFLRQRCNIADYEQLMCRLKQAVEQTDLSLKQRDFEHLLFNPCKSEQILHFFSMVESYEE